MEITMTREEMKKTQEEFRKERELKQLRKERLADLIMRLPGKEIVDYLYGLVPTLVKEWDKGTYEAWLNDICNMADKEV